MDNHGSIETREPQRQSRTKWNYKRIGIALVAVVFISGTAAYGGYSLAHRFSDGDTAKKPRTKPVIVVAGEKERPPTTTTTTLPKHISYTVQKGDSYYAIALKHKTSVDDIKKLNNIAAENNDLQIGMVLKIPVKEETVVPEESKPGKPENPSEEQKSEATDKPIPVSSKELFRGSMDKKRVALTFDAGSASEPTHSIVKTLKDANIKATFFLTGTWMEQNAELTKRIIADGHVLGNHTHTHPDLTKEKDADIKYQLNKTEEVLRGIAPEATTKPIFRPPYGARDGRVLRVAASAGYRSIYWSIDSLDWKPTMKPDQVKNRVLAALNNGAVILMHCGSPQTAEILPELIGEIRSRGYEMVTIPELFAGYSNGE